MTSYVWLTFYYYIMIVSSQRALFLWVKKNIKSVIYVMLFVDRLMFLAHASSEITLNLENSRYTNGTGMELIFVEFV